MSSSSGGARMLKQAHCGTTLQNVPRNTLQNVPSTKFLISFIKYVFLMESLSISLVDNIRSILNDFQSLGKPGKALGNPWDLLVQKDV